MISKNDFVLRRWPLWPEMDRKLYYQIGSGSFYYANSLSLWSLKSKTNLPWWQLIQGAHLPSVHFCWVRTVDCLCRWHEHNQLVGWEIEHANSWTRHCALPGPATRHQVIVVFWAVYLNLESINWTRARQANSFKSFFWFLRRKEIEKKFLLDNFNSLFQSSLDQRSKILQFK